MGTPYNSPVSKWLGAGDETLEYTCYVQGGWKMKGEQNIMSGLEQNQALYADGAVQQGSDAEWQENEKRSKQQEDTPGKNSQLFSRFYR